MPPTGLRVSGWSATALIAALAVAISAQSPARPAPPAALDAKASDPVAMKWMTGQPVPADQLVQFADRSFMKFPQSRWAFTHLRQLMPTSVVRRGVGPVSVLPRSERQDIDAVTFTNPTAVRRFASLIGEEQAADLLNTTVVATIGPVTASAASALGVREPLIADPYTLDGLVAALVERFKPRQMAPS